MQQTRAQKSPGLLRLARPACLFALTLGDRCELTGPALLKGTIVLSGETWYKYLQFGEGEGCKSVACSHLDLSCKTHYSAVFGISHLLPHSF